MKQKLDIETWARKDHFNFFKKFEEPFYGVCVTVDCTGAYKNAKEAGVSFFLYTLYKALATAQLIEPFKCRIEGDEVFIYDKINAASTIARSNGTFGFGYIDYHPSFEDFMAGAVREVQRVQSLTGLELAKHANVIRFSSLPWIDFTSLSHARMFSAQDSSPNISFGKMTVNGDKRTLPVSIHVHHALVDGLHIGQYIDSFQVLMNAGS